MGKVFDFKNGIYGALGNTPLPSELFIGSFQDGISDIFNEISHGKVEVFMLEKEFKRIGRSIIEKIKSFGVNVGLVLIDDNNFTYSSINAVFDGSIKYSIAVGDKYLLSAVRHYSSHYGVPCYAICTTPSIDKVFYRNVYLKTKGATVEIASEKFKKVIIDEDIVLKSKSETFAEAYASSIKKLTSLIDYKWNCFSSGEKVDEEVFAVVKKAVNLALSAFMYENSKLAILASQTILAVINERCEAIIYSGAETTTNALSVYAHETKDCKKEFASFEKTVKLYHAFFSNDFSNLLSTPNYYLDIETIERDFNRDRATFENNVKIPSERRRQLINALIEKTKNVFIAETSAILKAFPQIKKRYSSLIGVQGDGNISYKQIKNAVTAGTYLTAKTNVLTVMRDLGVLACAN